MRQTLFARLLHLLLHNRKHHYFHLAGLILTARIRDVQAIRPNPYCIARMPVVSNTYEWNRPVISFNKHKTKGEYKNEKSQDAVCNER